MRKSRMQEQTICKKSLLKSSKTTM
ncbi:Protein of unknown function [Bacillus cytotoxicus]|uniref:Uncharacterized protein n=1 Tax=Bacillus cytotoxicus TaxID=580165 RepID=A0AAX2CFP6_9BACI|nr:Protein of unknown function [Bacillus cytotoxicus]